VKAFRFAVLFLAFAALCGFIRWAQSTVAIPAEAIELDYVHDIDWDKSTKLLTRTGSDPFFVIALPDVAKPIRHVRFDFNGAYADTEGTFYLFPLFGTPPNATVGPLVHGKSEAVGGSFSISAPLDRAIGVRLDLPDFLPRPIELKRIVIETPFLRPGSTLIKLAFGSLAVALVLAAFSLFPSRRV